MSRYQYGGYCRGFVSCFIKGKGQGKEMEMLDIVDESGQPTGTTVERKKAHELGILHRTSHVWILRKEKDRIEVLLQKRSFIKDSFPGCLDISSAGHIPAGSDYKESAIRELQEELGIVAKQDELILCGQRRFWLEKNFHGKDFFDNQISNIYILNRNMEVDEFIIQKEEIDLVRWVEYEKCIDLVKNNKELNCIWLEELEMLKEKMDTVLV